VYGSEIVVSLNEDRVYATIGGLLTSGIQLDITPGITDRDAEEIARTDLIQPNAPILGQTRLMVFDLSLIDGSSPDPRLVWRVTTGEDDLWRIFVDAHTGQVIFKTAITHSGDGLDNYDFEEWDANGSNVLNSNCYWKSGPSSIGSENGLDEEYHNDPDAVAAWWYARDAYLFYYDTFGRDSYDNKNSQIEVGIYADVQKWGGAVYWWGCDIIEFSPKQVAFDIMVHELTHGVIYYTSNLNYYYESGALNESYADIMGSLADGNWTIGETRAGGASRSLKEPSKFSDPDHYSEAIPAPISNDYGAVHTNSSIPNHAAYLIAEGGTHADSGVTVKGIGAGKMGSLYYSVMNSLPSNATFMDARNKTVWTANSIYGPLTVCQIRNAFYAVGLGKPDIDCDGQEDDPDPDGDSVPFGKDNCPEIFNPKQTDLDEDGRGAGCDLDDNGNGLPDYFDTQMANPYNQCPTPGVPCDLNNYDGDQWENDEDNCPYDVNDDQDDIDKDGEGDACDPDADEDGWSNDNDNCPFTYNPDQTNSDDDGAGDACDPTPDCWDVMAWSKGTTIFTADGDVNIDPKPISDPMACLPILFLDGLSWSPITNPIKPDGREHKVEITPGDNPILTLPIPACPQDDPHGHSPDYESQLILQGVDESIGTWVVNDEGRAVAKAKTLGEARLFHFYPPGGDNHSLMLAIPGAESGQKESFTLSIRCGIEGQTEKPSAAPTTTTPTPTTTNTQTPTPTTTATAERRPCEVTALANLFCRQGPGRVFEPLDSFTPGQSASVIGQSTDGFYWYVNGPNFGKVCTVPDDAQLIEVSGDCGQLPRFTPIPTPTPSPTATATATPTPTETPGR